MDNSIKSFYGIVSDHWINGDNSLDNIQEGVEG